MLVERLLHEGAELDEAREAAAHSVALQLSWHLFEPYLRASAKLGSMDADHLQRSIRTAIDRIAGPYSVAPEDDGHRSP